LNADLPTPGLPTHGSASVTRPLPDQGVVTMNKKLSLTAGLHHQLDLLGVPVVVEQRADRRTAERRWGRRTGW